MPHRDYPVLIEPLVVEDGGGYLAAVPDLRGCMSDGESRELAARNVTDAIEAWIEEACPSAVRSPRPQGVWSRRKPERRCRGAWKARLTPQVPTLIP